MGLLKTKVTNATGSNITLKLNNGGIFTVLKEVLKDKEHHTITMDPNATYREYWCVEAPGKTRRTILSSDDCAEHREVIIEKDASGEYTWRGFCNRKTNRKTNKSNTEANTADQPSATEAHTTQRSSAHPAAGASSTPEASNAPGPSLAAGRPSAKAPGDKWCKIM